MDEFKKGVRLGLRAAATYLVSEAEDLEKNAQGRDVPPILAMTLNDRAKLLREQAEEVRGLTVNPGR